MKFKNDIELQAGLEDLSGSTGTSGQLLSSTGTGTSWIAQDDIISAASKLVVIACKNTHTATILKGTPVYQTGTVGATDVIEVAPADALISLGHQPAVGLLQQDLAINEFGNVVITGELLNFTTDPIDGLTPLTGQKVFLKSGGGLTLTKPTGVTNGIQNLGLIGKVSGGSAGSITVSSIMRTNDVPNLTTGKIWVGDSNTVESTVVHLDEVNGRVGINNDIPSYPLDFPTNQSGAAIRIGDDNVSSYIMFSRPRGYVGFDSAGYAVLQGGPTKGVRLNVSSDTFGNGTALQISDNGNVGIGTTSPIAKLDVDGDVFLASRHLKISQSSANLFFTAAAHDSSGTEGLLQKLVFKSVGTYFDNGFIDITDNSVALPLNTSIIQETISSGEPDWNILTLPKESGTFALENWVTSNFIASSGGPYLPLAGGTLSGRLVIDTDVSGDGGWDDAGILLRNDGNPTGEVSIAFDNIGTGANYWIQGLNQSEILKWAYGTSFTDGNQKMQLTSTGNLTVVGTVLGSNLSGTNTGDQDLSGYLTTTGKAADSDLLDGIDSSGFVKQLGDASSPNYTTPSSRRVNPNASNPTNEHYAVTTFGNDGNVTGQLATHFVSGLPYTRAFNTGWSSWRKIWTDDNDGSGSGLDADTLDGQHASAFLTSLPSHNHDDRYYTETESDGRFVNVAGDTMTGALTVTDESTGIHVNSAGHSSVRIDRGSALYDNNLLFYTAGTLDFRIWQDGSSDYLHVRDETGGGGNMVTFKKGGNVGIGTTSPSNKLSLAGSGQNWDTSPAIKMWDSFNSKGWYVGSANNSTIGDFYIRSVTTEGAYPVSGDQQFTIKQSGNVGIGLTSPTSGIHVNTSQSAARFISSQGAGLEVQGGGNSQPIASFKDTAASEKVRISSTGNVGIGTTAPSQKLHVAGNMRLQNQLYDSTNSLGNNGEVLTKVSAGTEWKAPAVNAQMPDNTAPASAANVGTIRYRSTSNTSFVDVSMQTGATTYTWVNIVSNFW